MRNTKFKNVTLYGLAAISLLALAGYFLMVKINGYRSPAFSVEHRASELMFQMEKATFKCQERMGLNPGKNVFDPNQTGLIGLEHSGITTTLGRLEAKRTTTNPDMAGLIVRLLVEAGVKPGDSVAVVASGSFPALILAVICAGQSLDLDLMLVVSIGSSQWGANNPEFTILDMLECWREAGLDKYRLLAVAWGGEDNSGREFPPEVRQKLEEKIKKRGLKIIKEETLKLLVESHLKLFLESARGPLKAFVNIGGSLVALGQDSSVLELRPGLTRVEKIPSPEKRGLIQEMAAQGIPVIHLLNIQGLVTRYGLPWDPQPLPQPGQSLGQEIGEKGRKQLLIIFISYLSASIIFLIIYTAIHKKRGRNGLRPDF